MRHLEKFRKEIIKMISFSSAGARIISACCRTDHRMEAAAAAAVAKTTIMIVMTSLITCPHGQISSRDALYIDIKNTMR